MKKSIGLILVILVSVSTVFAAKSNGGSTDFEINTKESKVYWTGKKVSGEHTGYLSIGNGSITVENNKVVGGVVNMDLNSIVCTDLTNEQWNQKLVGHLKSEDFFSVEKYPNANFTITSIVPDSENYKVSGKLTMKGATHEIIFPAQVSIENGVISATGTASIDRTEWNIKYGSGKFFQGLGDNLISDYFEIKFELKASANNSLTLK